MALSKLQPKMITLSFVALLSMMGTLSLRVLSMKTGYDYSTTGNPSMANQYRDLKCSYLFIAMTQMRLVRYILDDKKTPPSIPVALMADYNIRAVICTLYGVADVEIGTLWILLFYVNMAKPYFDDYIHKGNEADRKAGLNHLVLVHDYVAGRMYVELSNARCRPGNQYDSYEERYRRLTLAMQSGQFKKKRMQDEAIDNCKELNDLLLENNAFLTYGTRYEALRQRALFLDKLADNNRQKNRLMNVYDMQIDWERAPTLLTEYYLDAFKLHSHSALFLPLFPIKIYYQGVFSLFKCIVYRLTWKFLFYSNTFTGKDRKIRLEQWRYYLLIFRDKLHLHNDPEVVNLIYYMDQLGRNVVNLDSVIHELWLKLRQFEVILQCNATKSWTLKSEQPSSSASKTTDEEDIIQGIVKDIKHFVNDIQVALETVDLDVVQSIVNYVEDESKW